MPNVKYNGQVIKFPDDMSEDAMRRALTGLDKPDPTRGAGTDRPGVVPAIPTTQELHFPDEVPAQSARGTLRLASMAGVSADWASANKKEVEGSFLRDSLMPQMQGLPRLAQWGSQSDHHAAAISDDVDNLGVVDYFFGSRVDRDLSQLSSDPNVDVRRAPPGDLGPYNNAIVAKYGGFPETTPGWALNFGRWSYSALSSLQDYFESHFGTPDVERMKREQEISQTKLPGEDKSIGKILYGAQDVVQGVAPYMLNPALAYGLTYVQNTGSVYRQLRLAGWEHDEAGPISELAGFTSASVMAGLGGRLFGSIVPKGTLIAAQSAVGSSLLRAVSSNPGFWSFMYRTGVNQAYAALMNAGMAGSESAIINVAAAYKYGERVPYSKIADDVWKAVAGSFSLLPLSVFAAAKGVSHERLMYQWGEPLRAENKAQARSMEEELNIYDNFERAGLSLRSMHEASNLAAAVEAVKNSKFMQDNPRQGQLMIRALSDPHSKRQNVYVNPDVLMKMDPEERTALGASNVEEAYQSGSLVRVSMEKFLTHPDATSMLRDSTTALDLLTPKETKLKDWAEWANTEQPSPDSPVRRGRRPDEMLGFKGDLGQDRLNWWAAGQVKDRPIGDYDGLVNLHNNNERAARTNKENKEAQAKEALARAAGKAQEGAQRGVQGVKEAGTNPKEEGPGGFTNIEEVSQGMMEDLATTRLKSREQFKAGEKERVAAEDKGVLGTKEEVKAGDYSQEAKKFERVEKINQAMAKQLRRAREEAARLKDKINSFNSADKRRDLYHGGHEYGAASDAILEALGGKKRGAPAVDLNEVKEKIKSDNGVSTFDPDELNKLLDSPKGLEDMTLEEVTKVHDALFEINNNGLAQTQLRFAEVIRERDAFVNGVRDHLINLRQSKGQDGKPITPEALGNWGAIKQWFSGAKSEFLQPFTLFQMLGEGGDRMWFDGFIPGLTREERLHELIMPDLKKIEEALPKEVRDSFQDRVVPMSANGREPLSTVVRSDAIRLMLHLGTQSGTDKVSKGFGADPATVVSWAQANIARTPEHAEIIMRDYVEPMWRLFDKLWDQYEAQDFNGRPPPEKLKPVKVTVNGKEYQGGYGGWLHMVQQGKKMAVPGSMEELMGWHQTSQAATGQMHLQERTDAGIYPDLSLSGVASSISREIHDLAFYDFVRAMKFTFEDPQVRQLVAEKFGQQNLDQIYKPGAEETSWLHVLARGKVSDVSSASWFTRGVAAVNGYAAMQAFSLNARVLAMQLSHIPANAFGQGILNPLHIADAAAKAFNPDRRDFAHTVSQVLPFRAHDFARHNAELITSYTGIKQYDNVLTKMNWSMWQQVDEALSHAIWEMGVNHALGKGASTQDAYRAGDRAVEAGMPVQTIYQQSAFVRDRSWVGLSFLVRNFPNTLANMGMMKMWNARVQSTNWQSAIGPYARAGLGYLGMVASAEIFGKWLGGHGPKDDQWGSWLAQRGVASLGYPFMLGDVGEAGVHLLQGDKRGAVQALGHLQSPLVGEATRIANDFYDGVTKDDYKSIRAFLDLVGVATKTPIPRLADWAAAFSEDNFQEALATGMGYHK